MALPTRGRNSSESKLALCQLPGRHDSAKLDGPTREAHYQSSWVCAPCKVARCTLLTVQD
jgi:hypothetical protein